jgi:hypothetical protein
MKTEYYYLYKEGAHGHDVHWVGSDKTEGFVATRLNALNDIDNYHTWTLLRYDNDNDEDEVIFTTDKNIELENPLI